MRRLRCVSPGRVGMILLACAAAWGCRQAPSPPPRRARRPAPAGRAPPATRPAREYKVVHVFVALCDNRHQGIVPVPDALGNGQDPDTNLYWGAMYGVRTFFARCPHWTLLETRRDIGPVKTLERAVFHGRVGAQEVYVVADACDGARMTQTLEEFFLAAAGRQSGAIFLHRAGHPEAIPTRGRADMVCFVGHNGLMDAPLPTYPQHQGQPNPSCAVVLACDSRRHFLEPLRKARCAPLITTTGRMAPEAYTLDAIIRSWAAGETPAQTRQAAARAYAKYQKCSLDAARRLFATGG